MNRIFQLCIFILCLLHCFSATRRTGKTCFRIETSITLVPVTYVRSNIATYTTVVYRPCLYFPVIQCPKQIERTKVVYSIQTRLKETSVDVKIPICCEGYRETSGRLPCEPVCVNECVNEGLCYGPDECICRPQFHGAYCEQDVDECRDDKHCHHQCTNTFGSFSCSCNQGYYLKEDKKTCQKYSVNINSFKATLKTTESVRLDWHIESDPPLEDVSDLIDAISLRRIDRTDNSSDLLHSDRGERHAVIHGLSQNTRFTFELEVRTIYGEVLDATLDIVTPDISVQCNTYYTSNNVNPCRGGSICRDLEVSPFYMCECLPGFAGPDCQNINECENNPCQNGGICVDGINEYYCNCASSIFTGKNCAERVSYCQMQSSPCNGHGECIDGEETFTCNCENRFEGEFCETEIDHCTSAPCQNEGTCTNGDNGPICQCPYNFIGDLCGFNLNPCEGHNCNGADCFTNHERMPVCNCALHRYGKNCQYECKAENNELCNCDKEAGNGQCQGYCLEEEDSLYNIRWPNQTRGSNAHFPCKLILSSLLGNISRPCLNTARWGDINSTLCTPDSTTDPMLPFANCFEAEMLTSRLLNYTLYPKMSSFNSSFVIDSLFDLVENVAKLAIKKDCSFQIKERLVHTLSNLLNPEFISTISIDNKDRAQIFKLLKNIEAIITHLTPNYNDSVISSSGNVLIEGDNIDYISRKLTTESSRNEYKIDLPSELGADVSPYLSIPIHILEDNGVSPRVNILVIKSGSEFNVKRDTSSENEEVISNIVSVKISNMNQTFNDLNEPIELGFGINEEDIHNTSCVFLNDKGDWSDEGINLKQISKKKVVCNAYHLSIFTVIKMKAEQTPATSQPTPNTTETFSYGSVTVSTRGGPTNETTQENGFPPLNLASLIGSAICITLLSLFLAVYGIFRLFAPSRAEQDGSSLAIFYNLNITTAHLLTVAVIGFGFLIEIISQLQPAICFGERGLLQYGYMVSINSIVVEMVVALIYIRFADSNGNMRRQKLTIGLSILAIWGIPTLITLLTSIPMFSQYSSLQPPSEPLRCGFLSRKEVLFTLSSFSLISILILFVLVVAFIACYLKMAPKRESRRRNLPIKLFLRSVIMTSLHLLLILILLPANFLFKDANATSYIFYFHQYLLVMVLLVIMTYMERKTFKFWALKDDYSTHGKVEIDDDPPPSYCKPEIMDEGDYIHVGDMKIEKSHFLSKASLIDSRAGTGMTMRSYEYSRTPDSFLRRPQSLPDDPRTCESSDYEYDITSPNYNTLPRDFLLNRLSPVCSSTAIDKSASPPSASAASTSPRPLTPVDMETRNENVAKYLSLIHDASIQKVYPDAVTIPYQINPNHPYAIYPAYPTHLTPHMNVPIMIDPAFNPSMMVRHVPRQTPVKQYKQYKSKTPVLARRSYETSSTLSHSNKPASQMTKSRDMIDEDPHEKMVNTHPKLRRLSSTLP